MVTQQILIQPKVKERYLDTIENATINMSNPDSVRCSTAIFRSALASGEPRFYKMLKEMTQQPCGVPILSANTNLTRCYCLQQKRTSKTNIQNFAYSLAA